MTAQPWMKFFPTDWRSDPRLRMCGLAARGLWMEMLMLMHEATPYGHLTISGIAPTDAQLAVLVGTTPDQVPALISELEQAGVFSRNLKGVIYSRRMARDEKKARTARKNGQNGGNPRLCKQRDILPLDIPQVKGGDNTQKLEARNQKLEREESELKLTLENGSIVPFPPTPAKPTVHDLAVQAMAIWNATFSDKTLPQISKIEGQREKKFGARLMRDMGGDIKRFEAFCRQVRSSPFLTGTNNRGWVADFDWCMEPSNFTKIMEGRYDQRQAKGSTGGNQQNSGFFNLGRKIASEGGFG